MRRSSLVRRQDRAPLAALVLAVCLAWAWTYEMWTPAALAKPFEYWQDAMYQLGAIKAYGDRGLSSLAGGSNPYLGAPGQASWVDFPISEDVVYLGMGLVSRLVGPNAGINLSYLALAVLAAACMFLVARRLSVPAPFAVVAGACFGLSPFYHWRNLHHLNLAVYWHVPLLVLAWTWAASRRGLKIGERRFKVAAAIAVLAGIHNNYFFNYFFQVALLVLVLQALRKRWSAVRAIAALLGVAVLAFLLVNADSLVAMARLGRNAEAVNRSASETLTLALRPLELFIPSPLHRVGLFAKWGSMYRATAPVTGEFPSTFLGVIGCLGFVAMMAQGLRGLLFSEARGMATRFTVFSTWLVFVGMGGGLMQAAQAVLGFVAFRSNNRVSILLMALSLLYFGRIAARGVRSWKRGPVLALAAALTVFGLWEQAVDRDKLVFNPPLNSWREVRAWFEKKAASDEKFAAELEGSLPPMAALFNLPPMPFPEGGAPNMYDYDHFRPYLYTHQLRFSYGAMKGRPEGAYQFEVARLPPAQMIAKLKADGFSGIVFNVPSVTMNTVQGFASEAQASGARVRVIFSENQDWAALTW